MAKDIANAFYAIFQSLSEPLERFLGVFQSLRHFGGLIIRAQRSQLSGEFICLGISFFLELLHLRLQLGEVLLDFEFLLIIRGRLKSDDFLLQGIDRALRIVAPDEGECDRDDRDELG